MSEGVIVRVIREPAGTFLTAAVSPGDLALSVDWSIDFTPKTRRLLLIGGGDQNETLAYTAVDDEADVLTIEAPGAVLPWDEGDPVTPLNVDGQPEETWTIEVDMGDDGEPLPCKPSHALQDKLREDEEYTGLRCEVVGNEVTTLLDKAVSNDPAGTQGPLFVAYLPSDVSIPDGTSFTDVTGWLVEELRGGMVYDGIASVQVPLDGWYSQSADSALLWQANGTGRRAVQPSYATVFGDVLGGLSKAPGDASVQTTTAVYTRKKKLSAGEWIKLTASQTSGGALNVLGDALGISSFWCIRYEGPL